MSSNLPAGAEHDPNAPWNNEEKDNECLYCGEPTGGSFCDSNCRVAYIND